MHDDSESPLKAKSPLSKESKIVAIEGPIGVGKTALARMLADEWGGKTCFETFEDNPFLTGGFYDDKERYAFNTEFFFLLARYRQQKDLKNESGLIVTDYAFEKGRIFAKLNLPAEDQVLFETVLSSMEPQLRKPDLIVVLQSNLETLLRHVYFRDRRFERSLSPAYLDRLSHTYHRHFMGSPQVPVLQIQTTGLDFVNDRSAFLKVKGLIEDRLAGQYQLSLKPNPPQEARA